MDKIRFVNIFASYYWYKTQNYLWKVFTLTNLFSPFQSNRCNLQVTAAGAYHFTFFR